MERVRCESDATSCALGQPATTVMYIERDLPALSAVSHADKEAVMAVFTEALLAYDGRSSESYVNREAAAPSTDV